MEKHYFIGEGREAEKLIKYMMTRSEIARNARMKLKNDYGSDNLLLSRWKDGSVVGLFFREKVNIPFLKGGNRIEDGYAYYPKRNTRKGKELAERFKDKDLTFNASHFIIDALSLNRIAISGFKLYESSAGLSEDGKRILVIIPGEKAGEVRPSNNFPDIPGWMREVKESEFLAAQGR